MEVFNKLCFWFWGFHTSAAIFIFQSGYLGLTAVSAVVAFLLGICALNVPDLIRKRILKQ